VVAAVTPCIVILDDEPERVEEMTRRLAGFVGGLQLIVFDNAPDLIDWLARYLDSAKLICLDHDLGPNRVRNGKVSDPGIGRDVVDYLATRTPVCPVIIHTTNSLAAPGMELALTDAGWIHIRVVPYNDLEWIGGEWIENVKRALAIK
jgi:hypothetical protein